MKNIALALCLLALFVTPQLALAQGNNMDIYNKIIRQNNQKSWNTEEIEAPLLDVDAIVAREDAERRAKQQAQKPRYQPKPTCRVGEQISSTGCGTFGIHPCYCEPLPNFGR